MKKGIFAYLHFSCHNMHKYINTCCKDLLPTHREEGAPYYEQGVYDESHNSSTAQALYYDDSNAAPGATTVAEGKLTAETNGVDLYALNSKFAFHKWVCLGGAYI